MQEQQSLPQATAVNVIGTQQQPQVVMVQQQQQPQVVQLQQQPAMMVVQQPPMLNVTVPAGVYGGQVIPVQTTMGVLQVQVPQGMGPGQTFQIPQPTSPVPAYYAGNDCCCGPGGCNGCFPAGSIVQVLNNGTFEKRKIEKLRVGDCVMVADRYGKLKSSPVHMFLDSSAKKTMAYKVFTTMNKKSISISSAHLILATKAPWMPNTSASIDQSSFRRQLFTKARYIFSDEIQCGDLLWSLKDEHREGDECLEPSPVTKVEDAFKSGLYSPVTVDGSIIVGGVAASCFSIISSHTLAVAFFWPTVVLHKVVGHDVLSSDKESEHRGGIESLHWLVKASFNIGRRLLSKHMFHSDTPMHMKC